MVGENRHVDGCDWREQTGRWLWLERTDRKMVVVRENRQVDGCDWREHIGRWL